MHQIQKRRLCLMLSLILLLWPAIPALASGDLYQPTLGATTLLAGTDRYATAAAIAREGWNQSAYAILVSGENYPDALVAAPLAGKYDAPVILSLQARLPEVSKQILSDLRVQKVFLVGGTGVLSDELISELQAIGIETQRLAGADRYETAVAVAREIGSNGEILVVSGEDFADGLSVSPLAGKNTIPIILVPPGDSNPAIENFCRSTDIACSYVLWDRQRISASMLSSFPNVISIDGESKYERNAAFIEAFQAQFNPQLLFISTGENFPDALAGSALAAHRQAAICLIGNDSSSKATFTYLANKPSAARQSFVLGGQAIYSSTAWAAIVEPAPSRGGSTIGAPPGSISDPLTRLGNNRDKYSLIFGSSDNPKYESATEAAAHMVTIPVNVWRLNPNGEKTPSTLNLTIHQAIADQVQAVFNEIFAGEEQFPIYDAQGYSWRDDGTSEHNWGLAVDINPNENYQIYADGRTAGGTFWDPAASPYSIPADGDVVRAFRQAGFVWGGDAWYSSHDYMHFSYLGG